MVKEGDQAPDRKEAPPNDKRSLNIGCQYPDILLKAALSHNIRISGLSTDMLEIGFVKAADSEQPLDKISSWMCLKPELGDESRKFNVRTVYTAAEDVYITDDQVSEMREVMSGLGFSTTRFRNPSVVRSSLIIETEVGNFVLSLGYSDKESAIKYMKVLNKEMKKIGNKEGLFKHKLKHIKKGTDTKIFMLELLQVKDLNLSSDNLRAVEMSRNISEVVGTALMQVMGKGRALEKLRMDWLPPKIVERMTTSRSTEIVGRVDPIVSIEQKAARLSGFEKLAGLSEETWFELKSIKARLADPELTRLLQTHNFKQSNGAVFWGPPGIGKTLAGEALAEEVGCFFKPLRIDEYLTAYMHNSAKQLGEGLREIKQDAEARDRPVIIQIDEADTILRPVSGGFDSAGSRDATEIRGVLLREFQEPSNVFFILTTNLDPRDQLQADPAIVRNQRIGQLVVFNLPDQKGREETFKKMIIDMRPSGNGLTWDEIDYESLAITTDGFSQADIDAVITRAAELGYDKENHKLNIDQDALEKAVSSVKSRKVAEERVKQKMGFKSEAGE